MHSARHGNGKAYSYMIIRGTRSRRTGRSTPGTPFSSLPAICVCNLYHSCSSWVALTSVQQTKRICVALLAMCILAIVTLAAAFEPELASVLCTEEISFV